MVGVVEVDVVVVEVVEVEEIVVVGGARSVRPLASAFRSADAIVMHLAGGVTGENAGALAEKIGSAGCLRSGIIVVGVGIVVVVVVVGVMVVGVGGMVVVAGADFLLRRRPKRFRRWSRRSVIL